MFAEYWDRITISSFGVSLFVAIALQSLLKLTIYLENRAGEYFQSDESLKMKLLRILSAWIILFISKLIILEILQVIFGDAILFTGAFDGLLAFIVLVIAILAAEYLVTRLYKSLA